MADSPNGGEASVSVHSFPTNFPVPTAMICTGDLTGNWEFFKQQWMDYEVATGLDKKSQAVRLATLRSVMGKDCLQIFLNLDCGLGELTVAEALAALQRYFLPKRNVVYERYVFNSCIQTPQETVDSFTNRLRNLASPCKFGALTDEMIRDRLVIGVNDKRTKGRLLREEALTLKKALEMCRSSEITSKQLKTMEVQTPRTRCGRTIKPPLRFRDGGY